MLIDCERSSLAKGLDATRKVLTKGGGCECYSQYIDGKLLRLFSVRQMKQQVSPCYSNFLTVIPSYHSKVTPNGALHADQVAEKFFFSLFVKNSFPSAPNVSILTVI